MPPPETEASTSPGTRLDPSARARRIQLQRDKIEAVRRAERWRRIGYLLLFFVALGAAGFAGVHLLPARSQPVIAAGQAVAIEGNRNHLPQSADIPYVNRPPSSGDHYEQPAGYGFVTRPVLAGNWVHTLEHGGIVLLYRPDLCHESCQAQLEQLPHEVPPSQQFAGLRKLLVTPYDAMDSPLAVVAWGWVDQIPQTDPVDKERILAFYRAHVDRGPENVP